MADAQSLYGLVLSGGKSSRMGFDKGAIVYHGQPQRNFLFDLLSGVCSKVYTSCRDEHVVEEELNPIFDKYDFNSPLSGILTAFNLHREHAWLAVAVDLPNVGRVAIEKLVVERRADKLATCFFDTNANAREPLLTIWEPAAFPLLLQNAKEGNVSPRRFLDTAGVHTINDVPPEWFMNVNTPTDQKGRRL